MTRPPLERILLLVAVLVAVYFGLQARCARDAARSAGLRADSTAAANDTTRELQRALLGVLADSARAFERRSIQTAQERDALDRELKRTRVALVNISAAVTALSTRVGAPVTADSGDHVRRATFNVRTPPYTARAAVALPRPPASGVLDLDVALDTARIGLRLQCGQKGPTGIRPATALAVTPTWLQLRMDEVTQAPEVCNAERKTPWWVRPAIGGAAVLGYVLGRQ